MATIALAMGAACCNHPVSCTHAVASSTFATEVTDFTLFGLPEVGERRRRRAMATQRDARSSVAECSPATLYGFSVACAYGLMAAERWSPMTLAALRSGSASR